MYKRSTKGWIKHLDFFLIDILCVEIALILAHIIRFNKFDYTHPAYEKMAIIIAVSDILAVFFFNTFKNVLKRGFYKEFLVCVRQTISIAVLSTFYMFITQTGEKYSRLVLLYTCIIYFVLSYILRVIYRLILLELMRNNKFMAKNAIIVVAEKNAEKMIDQMRKYNLDMINVIGLVVIDKNIIGETICDVPVVADLSNVAQYVCREWVDEVFINMPLDNPFYDKLINQFVEMGVTTHMVLMSHEDFEANRNVVEKLAGYTVLTSSIRTISMWQAFLKRTLDIIGGLFGCLLTVILFIFVAPAIYIKSPGPIFFSQIRVGKNGKKFKIYKFRSMYMDAEERKKELMAKNKMDGLMFKMDQDPRIIGNDKCDGKGIGSFIRNTSIDEFPQFLNVLKGDMSLVGTRPPTVDEWEQYELHHRARLAIKPGITGLWQVSGRSNITDFEEVVKLDRQYISEYSFGQDIKILLKTVLVVLKRDGSV